MKYKIKNIWKSLELKVYALIFFIFIFPIVLILLFPEPDITRQELSTTRLVAMISIVIGSIVALKIVYLEYKARK